MNLETNLLQKDLFLKLAYTINAIYNGVTYTSGSVTASGSFTFDKNVPSVQEVTLVVSSDSDQNDTIQINVSCPRSDALNIYNICVTDPLEAGQFIHNEFSWTDGTTVSSKESNLVEFASTSSSFAISQYELFAGPQGSGVFPTDGSTVTVYSNKINFDDFVFDPSLDKFKYLRTNTFYQNNVTDITSLLSLAIDATPISTVGAPTIYSADFIMPATGSILYLIWDYRSSSTPSPTFPESFTDPSPTPQSQHLLLLQGLRPTPTPGQRRVQRQHLVQHQLPTRLQRRLQHQLLQDLLRHQLQPNTYTYTLLVVSGH